MRTNCAFSQIIDADEIDFPFPKEIPDNDEILPFTFVADKAVSLGIHVMRPYARTYRNFGNAFTNATHIHTHTHTRTNVRAHTRI